MNRLSAASTPGPQRVPLWALLAGLIFTGAVAYAVWNFTSSRDQADARVGFEIRASQIDIAIREHLRDHEHALLGMSALLTSGAPPSHTRWLAQFDLLRIGENFPGFQGIGYAPCITHGERARYETALQKEYSANVAIRPEGVRQAYVPETYLAPDNDRHRRAIGHDLYSEPLQRAALDRARDNGHPVLSRRLAPEPPAPEQPGLLLVMPVYQRGTDVTVPAQRHDAVQGFVYSALQMHDLINSMPTSKRGLHIEIFDGAGQRPDSLLYDSSSAANARAAKPLFTVLSTIALYGANWTLRIGTLPEFEAEISHERARYATAGAALICLLALAMIWSQLTLRRRAETMAARITRDLAQSREQLQLALEGSDLALFDWNLGSGEVQLSSRWNLMLGGKAEPVRTTSKALEALVPPEELGHIQTQVRALLDGSSGRYEVEHRVRRHDGAYIWIASHAKVVERDDMNRALRLVGTLVDVSKRKEMDRMKSEFISTVSHELRTPITAMIGALGLLRKGAFGAMPGKAATFLDMAYQNGEKLSALVNDILALEDMNAGRIAMRLEAVDVGSFLERMIAAHADPAGKKGIRITLTPVSSSLTVRADAGRLSQVFANLLSNAVKFSPDGETVTLGAGARDTMARISIIDHGPGIAEEFRSRLFERFTQADGSSTRAKGGTGLGLAVCKTLIEGMGGRIGYISEAGRGSTFYVELPMADAATADSHAPPS